MCIISTNVKCENMEPIVARQACEKCKVSPGSVTAFWNRRFNQVTVGVSMRYYRRACKNSTFEMKLASWLGEAPTEEAANCGKIAWLRSS